MCWSLTCHKTSYLAVTDCHSYVSGTITAVSPKFLVQWSLLQKGCSLEVAALNPYCFQLKYKHKTFCAREESRTLLLGLYLLSLAYGKGIALPGKLWLPSQNSSMDNVLIFVCIFLKQRKPLNSILYVMETKYYARDNLVPGLGFL